MKNPIALFVLMLVIPAFAVPASAAEDSLGDAETNAKTLIWSDGTRYVGGVENGKRSGKGTIFWQDGTRFVGSFKDDMRNGPGTMIMADGTIYNGYFRNDKLVEAPIESGSPEPDIDIAAIEQPAAPKPAAPAREPVAAARTPEPVVEAVAATEAPAAGVKLVPSPPATVVVEKMSDGVKNQLVGTITGWANAWQQRDVNGYLKFYGRDFEVPGKQARSNWEALRRSRITRPRSIDIDIRFDKFEIVEPDHAEVTFRQTYNSDVYSDVTDKVLKLRWDGEGWKILQERSL